MKIAIVILNWNGKELLEKFLPSVIRYSTEADIYLIDNASSDDSVSFVKLNFPQVSIIKNTDNGGYAKGYNDGLTQVDADIYCLLNSDVEVTENWLNPVIRLFEKEPNTVVIQPKILDYNNKNSFEYAGAAGGFIDKYGYPFCRGRIFNSIEKDLGQYDDIAEIFWASGACLFIRKSTFQELNGFDTSFFAHMEEVDLCWRIKNLGHSIKYVGTSTIYHIGGATLSNTNPKKTYLNFRNSLITITKNTSGNLFFLVLIRLILDGVAGVKFIFDFKPKHTLAIIKAHFAYYQRFRKTIRQRKSLIIGNKHYNTTSIVWSYYLKKLKTFNRL